MKPVLILQHQTPEYPAYLVTWLKKHSIPYVAFNAERGPFPESMAPYSALAVMGGAMSANDPLLSNKQAEVLILQAMYRDKPVIGHCLGGQLMAKALGAKVVKSPMPEIGWQSISWVDNYHTNHWFGNSRPEKVIHWHYDAFDVPEGATPLATSSACPYQAFAIDKHLAMQFHIEIDREKVHAWVADSDPQWLAARLQWSTVQDGPEMIADIDRYLDKHQRAAEWVYRTWLKTTCWVQNYIYG